MKGACFFAVMLYGLFCTAPVYAFDAMYVAIPPGLLIQSGLGTAFVAKFALFVALFLAWTVICGRVFKYLFKLPIIAGQIIGGVLLGPSFIDIAQVPYFAEPLVLAEYGSSFVYSLASSDLFIFFLLLLASAFTVSYLLWIAGYETDVRDILNIGITPIVAGFLGALLPIGMTAFVLWYGFGHEWSVMQSISMGVIFAATSVSIPIAMLITYGKMHLKSSKATLGAAIIDDILAVILLSGFFLAVQSGFFGDELCHASSGHCDSLITSLSYMVSGFALLCVSGYFFVPRLIHFLQRKGLHSLIAPVANIMMFASFAFSELFAGLAGITGAYFAGLFHRLGDTRHRAEKVIAPFVNAVLLPLFLGSIGLQVNISVLNMYDWFLVIILLLVAIASKMFGCLLATALSNFLGQRSAHRWSLLETYLFGSSMVARGEVGLVIATILYSAGLLEQHQYVIGVVVIVLTTVVASIMLSLGFSYSDSFEQLNSKGNESIITIGPFPAIGTMQMFNVIIGQLKVMGMYKTFIPMSEGRKVINIEEQQIQIVMQPGRPIIFKGDSEKIIKILDVVKNAIIHDVERVLR